MIHEFGYIDFMHIVIVTVVCNIGMMGAIVTGIAIWVCVKRKAMARGKFKNV